MMRELKAKPKNEVEVHIENPQESPIFTKFPEILKNKDLTQFICDYFRLLIMGHARPDEIESLMDEEIQTVRHDSLKSYHALSTISEAFPALGIVAAVLGVIRAMAALDQPPEVLGELIGSAMVGTFAGIFLSYAVVSPIAGKIKAVREKKLAAVSAGQADNSCVHEWRHGHGRRGAWPQDDFRLRKTQHRSGGSEP